MAQGTDENPHTYPHGVPCWIEHEAPDPDGAIRFYGALFGWTFEDKLPPGAPERFILAQREGKDAASISTTDGPARWVTYISVDNADAAYALALAEGGTATDPPADAGPAVRWAGVRDPEGVEFRLYQAGYRLGSQVNNAPNSWNFSDLHARDVQAALGYYTSVFGWIVMDLGEQARAMLRVEGYGDHLESTVDPGIRARQAGAPPEFADVVAGAAPTAPGEEPQWHVSFSVADRDASAALAEGAGGTVVARHDGKWALTARVRDPWGAEFTLSEFNAR